MSSWEQVLCSQMKFIQGLMTSSSIILDFAPANCSIRCIFASCNLISAYTILIIAGFVARRNTSLVDDPYIFYWFNSPSLLGLRYLPGQSSLSPPWSSVVVITAALLLWIVFIYCIILSSTSTWVILSSCAGTAFFFHNIPCWHSWLTTVGRFCLPYFPRDPFTAWWYCVICFRGYLSVAHVPCQGK